MADQKHPLHQLDFHCTVYCGNKDALLALERLLQLPAVVNMTVGEGIFNLIDNLGHGALHGFEAEVDSVDINWADEEPADGKCECCGECPCICLFGSSQ